MTLFEAVDLTREPWFRSRSLALAAGEVVVLRGPSGSGKSLFLRTLADLDPRDGGGLVLEGRDVESMTPQRWRRSVRYVQQRPPRWPGTVGACIERLEHAAGEGPTKPLGVPPGLRADQRVADLSGGEAQRLALHVALGTGARVLLLDEPTSALDTESARDAERRLVDWVEAGGAALWVTHDEGLAGRVGAREVAFA